MPAPQVPQITTPAPNRNDPDTFSPRMDTFLGEFPSVITGINTVSDFCEDEANRAETEADASAASATASQTSRLASEAARDASQGFRNQAEDFKDSAEVAAAAAQSAAGLPSLVGNGLKFLQAQAGEGGVQWAPVPEFAIEQVGIFAAGSEDRLAWPEEISSLGYTDANLPNSTRSIYFTNGLFCVTNSSSASNCHTSPDGITWTARALPSAGIWNLIDTAGGNLLAMKTTTTDVYRSTDGGVTWSVRTAAPNAHQGNGTLVRVGSRILARGNSTTNLYYTEDEGSTWSGFENAPANIVEMDAQAGLFVIYVSSSSTYWTSSTGLTGTWTSRTIPSGTNGRMYRNITGSQIYNAAAGAFFESTDAINWTAVGFSRVGSATWFRRNDVYFSPKPSATAFGYSRHSDILVKREPESPVTFTAARSMYAVNGSGVYVVVGFASAQGLRFTLADLDAAQGYFVVEQ